MRGLKKCAALLTAWLLVVLVAMSASAQSPGKIPRIGFLGITTPVVAEPLLTAFEQGLREQGLIVGQNVVIERRFAEGDAARLPALAAELVALKVDVIVTVAPATSLAAKQATSTVPIVFNVPDPIESGLVKNLARPGGNLTGISSIDIELGSKRLELLKEAFPSIARVGVQYLRDYARNLAELEEVRRVAKVLKVEIMAFPVERFEDYEAAHAALRKAHGDATLILQNPVVFSHRQEIAEVAAKSGLPAMYSFADFVEAGGLMSYATNYRDTMRRAASYVDRILKGAKPGDLPVQQPSRFELVLNLKAAKALGLTFPQTILLRADKVIE
jgi:putative ABC transport system substrate-binding protein